VKSLVASQDHIEGYATDTGTAPYFNPKRYSLAPKTGPNGTVYRSFTSSFNLMAVPLCAPGGPMLHNPIEKSFLKTDIVPDFFALNPFVP
jgi:hypothetical protein